ncbi:YciI family protein [Pyxidicoccus sp. 3LG]
MRFMMIVKSDKNTESGAMPTQEELAAMGKYNEELVKAGVLLAGEGLHPSAKGARIQFNQRKPTVIDGPFAESKELIAGFWIIQVKSREEALEWARRVPFVDGELELRQVFDAADFAASDPTGELREAEERLRAQAASRN